MKRSASPAKPAKLTRPVPPAKPAAPFTPAESFIIRDLDTLKVVADSLRTQIIEALIHEPLTVKQVADKLGLAPGKLYYHFNLLEKHGLIQAVETRVIANIIEKLYQATSSNVEVDPALLSLSTDEGHDNVTRLLTATVDATRDDILRSIQARLFELGQGATERPRRVVLTRLLSFITEQQADEFRARLEALLREFDSADTGAKPGREDSQAYALTIAFYPSFYFHSADAAAAEAAPTPKRKQPAHARRIK